MAYAGNRSTADDAVRTTKGHLLGYVWERFPDKWWAFSVRGGGVACWWGRTRHQAVLTLYDWTNEPPPEE